MKFNYKAIDFFVEDLRFLLQKTRNGSGWTPSRISAHCQLLDQLLIIDSLKNTKASLNNDFSFYRRLFILLLISSDHPVCPSALQHLKMETTQPEKMEEVYSLREHVATQNSVTHRLRESVQKLDRFEKIEFFVS